MKTYQKQDLSVWWIQWLIEKLPDRTCCQLARVFDIDPNKLSSRLNKLANKGKIYRYQGLGQRSGIAWRYRLK